MQINFLDDNFTELNVFVKKINPSKIFILVDENTHEYCLPTLLGNLETHASFEIIEIEAGEESKNIQTTVQLWEILAEFEADRKSLMLNLGGGMVSDLGGFVSSTYKRGIKFINIPTTLLAMVDASIGGKTGIDHQFYKNIIGTFSANIKLERVLVDFKEENIRKTLNFGHTIGHAVESLFLKIEKPILHGEAVALGMICETYLSYLEQLISEEITLHIIQNIQHFFPYLSISLFSDEEIISLILQDKKNNHGKINFSLLSDIGQANYNYQSSLENIILSLEFYRNLENL